MGRVLAISSWTAASRVGLAAMLPVFWAAGLSPLAAPTVTLGRHPGGGAPGGGPVDDNTFASLLAAALAHPEAEKIDWVITGYFASPAQIETAARHIAALKDRARPPRVAVDPVMGDAPGGLYVPSAVAEGIAQHLVPLADLLTPNAFEAQFLTGRIANDVAGAIAAARALGRHAAVTSVARGDRLGAVYVDGDEAWFAHGAQAPRPASGAGDLFAAHLISSLAMGHQQGAALWRSVAAVDAAFSKADADALTELPVIATPPDVHPRVLLEPLDAQCGAA